MHIHAVAVVDHVRLGAAGDHVNHVPQLGDGLRQLLGEAADAADLRGVFVGDVDDVQPAPVRRCQALEAAEGRRPGREVAQPPRGAAGAHAVDHGLLHAAHEMAGLLGGEIALAELPARALLHHPRVEPQEMENLRRGLRGEAVLDCEQMLVFHRGVGVEHHFLAVADMARRIAMDDRGGAQRHQPEAVVDHPHAHFGLVVEIFDRFVEAADRQQRVAAERAVGSLQIQERIGAGIEVAVEGRFDIEIGLAPAETGGIIILEFRTAVVIDQPADAADIGLGLIDLRQILEPVRIGHRVVVDEGHHVAGGEVDAAIARHAEVAVLDRDRFDQLAKPGEVTIGAVGGGPVDDDDLEGGVFLNQQRTNRIADCVNAIICRYDHGNPRGRARKTG